MCSLVGLLGDINQAHIKAVQIFKTPPDSCFVYFACRSERQDHRGQCGEMNLGRPATAVRNHQICHSSHFNSQQESDLRRRQEKERERDGEKEGRRENKKKRTDGAEGDINREEDGERNEINRERSKDRGAEGEM